MNETDYATAWRLLETEIIERQRSLGIVSNFRILVDCSGCGRIMLRDGILGGLIMAAVNNKPHDAARMEEFQDTVIQQISEPPLCSQLALEYADEDSVTKFYCDKCHPNVGDNVVSPWGPYAEQAHQEQKEKIRQLADTIGWPKAIEIEPEVESLMYSADDFGLNQIQSTELIKTLDEYLRTGNLRPRLH